MEQYADVQQLMKKEDGQNRKPIYPPTVIQAVFDGKTGASLEAILAQFNSIYVQYQGTPKDTRLIIPKEMRRAGLTITYMDMESNTITERANSAVQKDNDHWGLDVNWSRVDELSLSGDISVSAKGTWIINGKDTGVKALGPKGDAGLTPWLKTIDNKLNFSYDNVTWEPCSENIAAWFRWNDNKIQISRDNKTWTDLSGKFADNVHIKGYVANYASLPSGAVQGDVYGVGPTYAAEDTAHSNPIYRYYVRNANSWVDNGSFTSIAAGVVQETGDSETEVMSQKAVTGKLSELGSKTDSSVFGYFHQSAGRKLVYEMPFWVDGESQCEIEYKFSVPNIGSNQFLFAVDSNKNIFMPLYSHGEFGITVNGVEYRKVYLNSYLGQDVVVKIKQDGTILYLYINDVLKGRYENFSGFPASEKKLLWLGSYEEGLAAPDFNIYYFKVTANGNSWIVNTNSKFVERTADLYFGHLNINSVDYLLKKPDSFVEAIGRNEIITGEYELNETINLTNYKIRGNNCIVHVGPNAKIIVGDYSLIDGIIFVGDWESNRTRKPNGEGNQVFYTLIPLIDENTDVEEYIGDNLIELKGINSTVSNCSFEHIDRCCASLNHLTYTAYDDAKKCSILNNLFFDCKCAIKYQSEFCTVLSNKIMRCVYGLYAIGGNLSFVGNKIVQADIAIYGDDSGNGGHSEFTGNEIAHCGIFGFYANAIGKTLGNTYSGGQIFDAPVKLVNSSGFNFTGCRLDTPFEIVWEKENYPQGVTSNMVHSCYITGAYADRDNKPLFIYPGISMLSLKINKTAYPHDDSEVNN